MSRDRDLKVLGQDDWLLFARTATGVLVYTVVETDWHWLEAPNEGLAKHGSPEWREDNQFMHGWVSGRPEDYDWHVYDIQPWPREQDDAFVQQSAAHYLPRKEQRSVRRWPWPRPGSAPRRRVRRARHVLVELTLVGSELLYQVARLSAGKIVPGRRRVGSQRGRATRAQPAIPAIYIDAPTPGLIAGQLGMDRPRPLVPHGMTRRAVAPGRCRCRGRTTGTPAFLPCSCR